MAREGEADRWRTSPLVMRRWLGSELVRLRAAAGLTQRHVAIALGCSVGKVSYLESGERVVSGEELRVLLDLYDVPSGRRGGYLGAVQIASSRGWWDGWSDEDLPRAERRYFGMEDGATRLRAFLPSIVHGLLQTPEYTKGILRTYYKNVPEARIVRLVKLRQIRQLLLTRSDEPLRLHMIFDEAAVIRQVCSKEAMKAQLLHIATMGETRENITVQVLPFSAGSHGAYFGPFSILEFPWDDDSGLVYVEGLVEGRYLDTRADVYEHAVLFERLAELAWDPEKSLEALHAQALGQL